MNTRESVLIACAALVAALGLSAQTVPRDAPVPLELRLDASTRLLVVAPHPDDEALGAAGLTQRVRAHGGRVRALLMTSGDAFPEGVEAAQGIAHPGPSDYRGYGVVRERESLAAMQLLGVPASDVTFLGFPDEGLCRLASTYLFDKRRAFSSPYTNRAQPPATEQIIRGVRYRGVDVRREIEQVVTTFAPTLIALPHPDDEHPDHCSTHLFVREALNAVGRPGLQTRVLHYLVHYEQWPLTADAGAALGPPADFRAGEGRWASLALTAEEAAGKRRALLTYTTQLEVIGRFLLAFGRDNELYLEGEPRSSPDCWCEGVNVNVSRPPPAKAPRRP